MFLGVTSHHDALRVASYEGAERALERAMRTPTGKRRTEKPLGFHLGMSRNHGVTWAKRHDDDSIAFRLYDTDVVTWYPDNSVVIDNFGTVTTSGFASRFLPGRLHLRHPVCIRGNEGGDRGISYVQGGEYRLCHGGLVRFVEVDGDWVPDETTCDPIDMPVLNSARSREIGKRLNISTFEDFLVVTSHMIEIAHDEFDLDECVAALERRDFRRAAETLPPIVPGSGFGLYERVRDAALPIRTGNRDSFITLGSIAKLRLAVYEQEGMIETVRHTTIACRAYDAGMRRGRELQALGAGHGRWGIS